MNKIRKLLVIVIILSIFVSGCSTPTITKTTSDTIISGVLSTDTTVTKEPTKAPKKIVINIGDYIQMGRYYNEPIQWRCVDIDSNGPLMLADRILTIKPFDASGQHKYLDGTLQSDNNRNSRSEYGSNLWETSIIRSWLNSTAKAGNVTWLGGNPPTADKLADGYNAYANEKGFLAEGNFTTDERNAIKSVTQKSILNGLDANKLKVGGTATHIGGYIISKIVQNYDTAYYQNVTDKIFLLDVKQVTKVYQNRDTLGVSYYIGKPTQKAVDNSENKDSSINSKNYFYYWTRSPEADSDFPSFVRFVSASGDVVSSNANIGGSAGIRPALYLDITLDILFSGSGTELSPYILG